MTAKYTVPYKNQRRQAHSNAYNQPGHGHGGGMSTTGPEKRLSVRKAFDIKVGISTHHRIFVGLASNISDGGLFVATEEDLDTGDHVDVRFQIPGSDYVFQKRGEVCWIRPFDGSTSDNDALQGAGLRLVDLTDDERKMLNEFIGNNETLFFDT